MTLRLDRWGVGWAVFEGRKRVSGAYNCRDAALTRLEHIADRDRRATHARHRACLTCGTEFWSEGRGNRMCARCRWRTSETDAQMAG